MGVSVDGISPADLVRELLGAELIRLEARDWAKCGSFWGCFESYHEGFLECLDAVGGSDVEAVREACYDAALWWQSAISFGGFAEDLSMRMADAVASRFSAIGAV